MSVLIGSICVSSIPKELLIIKRCKDGVDRVYVNIMVARKKRPSGESHVILCNPNKYQNKKFRGYYAGCLEERESDYLYSKKTKNDLDFLDDTGIMTITSNVMTSEEALAKENKECREYLDKKERLRIRKENTKERRKKNLEDILKEDSSLPF